MTTERELLVQRERDDARCVHFGMRGLEVTCGAGVDVRAHVGGELRGWFRRLPCRTGAHGYPVDAAAVRPCLHYQRETIGAIEARVDEELRSVAAFLAGRSPCCDAPIATVGLIRCPTCGRAVGRGCAR